MLLVEGKSDRDLLLRAFSDGQVANPFDIRALGDLDERLQGGDDVARWLKYNGPALSARPDTSPVFVLRDWESGQGPVNQIESALAVHPTSRCIVWPEDLSNQDLSHSFVGIEKYLSTPFIEHVGSELSLPLTTPALSHGLQWRYDVSRQTYVALKPAIHRELAERCEPSDIAPLIGALGWLLSQLAETPPLL
jgi:hypothetical protein